MKRKAFLQNTAAVIGSSLLPALSFAEVAKKTIRIAHLSDIHVKPGIAQETGMAKALQHVQSLKTRVDLIVNGGDAIYDALAVDKQNAQIQWDLFRSILKKENSIPVKHVVGNHDIWGWFIKENRPEKDPLYGKAWIKDLLELSNTYYSFSISNWHFIVLDSTQLNPAGGYIAKLDPVQLDWFKQELASIPSTKHICIISHIPVLSICAGLFFEKTEANGDRLIKRNLMHTDYIQLKNIFSGYPNIRCCISGHIHQQDELEYAGIRYYCNGAVCGNWWNGAFQGFAPAYALMEFYNDGSTKRTIFNYQ